MFIFFFAEIKLFRNCKTTIYDIILRTIIRSPSACVQPGPLRIRRYSPPFHEQTDDPLPFRNSLLGEYALLMAKPPLGFGLGEKEIAGIAAMGMKHAFGRQ